VPNVAVREAECGLILADDGVGIERVENALLEVAPVDGTGVAVAGSSSGNSSDGQMTLMAALVARPSPIWLARW
jgi:hypothetical protein